MRYIDKRGYFPIVLESGRSPDKLKGSQMRQPGLTLNRDSLSIPDSPSKPNCKDISSTLNRASWKGWEGAYPCLKKKKSTIIPSISLRNESRSLKQLILQVDHYWIKLTATSKVVFAARVQLIKSVFMALNTYWWLFLPKGIIKEIEKRLWKGVAGMGYSKVAWSQVCNPVDEGGLGVRDFQSLNLALMTRRLWESMAWGWTIRGAHLGSIRLPVEASSFNSHLGARFTFCVGTLSCAVKDRNTNEEIAPLQPHFSEIAHWARSQEIK
ncbi:UNVERIFIED_CONTAM: hypothetical protein Scaly_2718800 [Sesamum calycinum]|uniref:Uncharacterized protein n=1 Tax=Sesamum calycinum TaxID=2727403 RepID=A0AAW2J3I2_9LAMI